MYVEEDPAVSEAIRRLPQQEQHLRLYRIKRAIDLSMKHAQLPKEQWTTETEVNLILFNSTCYSIKLCSNQFLHAAGYTVPTPIP